MDEDVASKCAVRLPVVTWAVATVAGAQQPATDLTGVYSKKGASLAIEGRARPLDAQEHGCQRRLRPRSITGWMSRPTRASG